MSRRGSPCGAVFFILGHFSSLLNTLFYFRIRKHFSSHQSSVVIVDNTGSNMPGRTTDPRPQESMRPAAWVLLAVAAALACSAADAGSGFESAAPRRAFPRRVSHSAAEALADAFGTLSRCCARSLCRAQNHSCCILQL
jgi:hypothetical protein